MSDFQQTVDLRKKMERPRKAATPLEKIYRDENEVEPKADLKTISRPKVKEARASLIKPVVFILAILAIAAVYFLFFRAKSVPVDLKDKNWYAIKLVDGEIFYGQITDVKTDPVAVANAYYNYDQAKAKETGGLAAENSGNLRLVKRGQETHGPAGSMDIVRAQILFMEPLKSDSKVLKAILDYEK